MKPEHFVKIRRRENCEECDHLREGFDEGGYTPVCWLHDFPLPSRTTDYRCEDFTEAK